MTSREEHEKNITSEPFGRASVGGWLTSMYGPPRDEELRAQQIASVLEVADGMQPGEKRSGTMPSYGGETKGYTITHMEDPVIEADSDSETADQHKRTAMDTHCMLHKLLREDIQTSPEAAYSAVNQIRRMSYPEDLVSMKKHDMFEAVNKWILCDVDGDIRLKLLAQYMLLLSQC